MSTPLDRRRFLLKSTALGVAAAGLSVSANKPNAADEPLRDEHDEPFSQRRCQPYPDNKPRVILIRFGVIRVADVDAHREPQQLAAEVVFQPGSNDLLAIV